MFKTDNGFIYTSNFYIESYFASFRNHNGQFSLGFRFVCHVFENVLEPTLQLDHQVNPENRNTEDSKTAFPEFAII